MTHLPTEASITRRILEWFRLQSEAFVVKTSGDPHRRGLPDILGAYKGCPLALEVKRPGEHATELQRYILERFRRAGAVAGVVRSVDDVVALLKQYGIDVEGETIRATRRTD